MSYQLNPLLLEDSPLYIPWSDKNYVGASTFAPRSVDVIDTAGRTAARKADVEAAFAPYKGKPLPTRGELRRKRMINKMNRRFANTTDLNLIRSKKAALAPSNAKYASQLKRLLKK